MIVCSCLGLTERRIRAEIEAGASTLDELARRCGAGRECGACAPDLADMLGEPATERPAHFETTHEQRREAQRGLP